MAKQTSDLSKMSFYILQQALYAAHDLYDQPATKAAGATKIKAIYEEYARRGFANMIVPQFETAGAKPARKN